MVTLCIIQARLGSTRFPNKALALLWGHPIIWHVVNKARQIRGVDKILVATSKREDGYALAKAMPNCGDVFSFENIAEDDVLCRFAHAATVFKAKTVMRLTGDCPLLNPTTAEDVLALYLQDPRVEYASNVSPGYVDGEDVEVFSASALLWANRSAHDPYDREHVTPWLRRNVKTATLKPQVDRSWLKTSIDTPEDLERVRQLAWV